MYSSTSSLEAGQVETSSCILKMSLVLSVAPVPADAYDHEYGIRSAAAAAARSAVIGLRARLRGKLQVVSCPAAVEVEKYCK